MATWKNIPTRLLRDSRLGPIGGGTSEILKEIL
jgi:alkylation response protein AidB-like acyl-CoA dehydrogenase